MNKKVIWITGGSTGIGKALALKFANNGWTVAISARRENLLKEIEDKHQNIKSFPLDVNDKEKCKSVFENIKKELGDIEICFFSTGTWDPKKEREMPFIEKLKLLRAGIIPFAIFFVMTGLFIMGIASLVECSAVGALAATLAAWSKGRLNLRVIEDVCKKTLGVSCMFMWIILAALCFGAVFDGIGAVKAIESLFIERWNLSPWGVLIMMQLSYILMGMFLDDTAMLVIVAPLYVPLIIALGFDPIWYGVLYTITCQIAYMTPPFGYNLFLMKAMAPKEISLIDIYRSIIPFVLVMLFGLIIMMMFPQIALWLPTTLL